VFGYCLAWKEVEGAEIAGAAAERRARAMTAEERMMIVDIRGYLKVV
jgi:hypothetical protein